MEDICFEISSSVSKALPAFVKQQYHEDCSIFLDFIEKRWKNSELSSMLTCIDKYLQYTCGENSQPTLELLKVLVPIGRKLWLISMYNIIKTNNLDVYYNESELEQVYVFQNKLSLKLRVRCCKLLNSILECCVHLLHSIWEKGCKERAEYFNEILDFIRIEVILKAIESYFSPDYSYRMAVSYTKRRGWITSLVRLSYLIRRIWIFRRDIGNFLVKYILRYNNQDFSDLDPSTSHTNEAFSSDISLDPKFCDEPMSEELAKELRDIEIDVGNCVIFYKFRIILLLCPNSTLYDLLVKGLLFKWWDLVNGDIVSSWHPMFFTFFFRAAKFGWATSQCVCPHFKGKIPTIFNITLNLFDLPNKPKLEKYKEIMPGEYTCLLPKTFKLFKKTSKLLILILHENDLCTRRFSSSLSLNHESSSMQSNGVELSEVKEEAGEFDESFVDDDPDDIFRSLKRLINILYPYAHPSSSGKWSHNISLFLKYIIVSHSRKLLRNKYINRKSMDSESGESGRDNICDMLYTISLIGIYNKNMKICNNYEIIIRNICYINKEDYLIKVVEYFTESLTECAEHNRLLTSIRVIIQLIPLIVKHMPHMIMNLFYTAISYIALSEPFINIQILILISLMLEYLFSIKNNLKSLNNEDNKFSLLTPRDGMVQENLFEGSNEASEVYDELMFQLNEFTIVYVDKVLELYENINEVDLKGMSLMNNVDVSIYILIKSTIINLLSVVDDETMSVILNKLMKFIDEYSYKLTIIKHVTSILSSISYLKGTGTTTKLMINNIKGLSEDDKRLRFHLNCLISAIRYNFNSNYFSEIREVINKGLQYKNKHAYKLIVKLIYRLNHSIYNIYTTAQVPTTDTISVVTVDNGETNIGWYVPSMSHYKMYKQLLLILMDTINLKYNGLNEKTQPDDSTDDEINKIIILCKYLIKSIVLVDIEIKDSGDTTEMSENDMETSSEQLSQDELVSNYSEVVNCLNEKVGDNFSLRGTVEKYVLGVVSKIYKKVYGSVVSEKLTKFINFLASKNYFSTDISNNYDFIFNLKLQNNVSITTTKPVVKYISFHCGLTKNSYLMDINFSSYMTIVQDYFYNFINLRKINYNTLAQNKFENVNNRQLPNGVGNPQLPRFVDNSQVRSLVDLVVVKICELNYKNVVNNSIMILKSITMIHKNMKYYVLSAILKELVSTADDNFTLFHNILPLFDANTLTYISLNFTLLELFLKFFLKVISTNNDSLITKYDVLFILFLSQRELDSSNDKIGVVDSPEQTSFEDENVNQENIDIQDTPSTVKIDKMLSVLRNVMSVAEVDNWRYNIYFCTLLLIYSKYVVYENKFFLHVLSLLNDVNNNYLQSLAYQYMLITLMSLNSGRVADSVVKEKLLDLSVMNRIFNGLVYCNHDVTTVVSNNLSSIVMNVIKFDKSWPRNRISSNSTIVSKYNFFLSYHYFKFLMNNSQTPEKHVEALDSILYNLLEISSDYIEYHLSLMEIMGGVLKCILELWDKLSGLFLKFMTLVSKHLSVIKLEYVVHYMDTMRLVLQGKNDFTPLINFLLNCTIADTDNGVGNLCNNEVEDTLESVGDGEKRVSNGVFYDEIKQLKLFQVLLQENIRIDEQLLSKKMESLLKDLGSKSFKVRNEIYTIVAFVRFFYGMKLEVPDDPVFVTTYYKVNLYNLDVEGISGHINTIQNEKLTNDIYNVISHVPRHKIHCVVKQLVKNIDNKRLKLLDMIFFNNVFYIVNTKTIKLLFNSYINKLNAKSNLTNVISSLNDETLNRIISKIDKTLNNIDVIICIINSIKYNIPKWLPNLLLSLVKKYYNKESKTTIESTLQDFFKLHGDDWKQIYSNTFTSEQLQVLNIYKGSPLYFN